MNDPTLPELLSNVLRDTGWIMAGGSAQFRQGALAELQSNLRLVRQHAGSERLLNAVQILWDKAAEVAAKSTNDTETILNLRRNLEEFEKAMKGYLATAKKR
jgi:hypothetical protein